MPQSPGIGQNSDKGIYDFRISGQSLLKIIVITPEKVMIMDMKPITKLDKRNKTTSNKVDDDAMSENCDAIAIFLIYGQFGGIGKLDSGRIVCKAYIFINSHLLSYKN